GRIISFDVTGGRYEERAGFHAIGSGSPYAKSALKKLYDADADLDTAVKTAVAALYDAADDDSATGGPDMVRRIFPQVASISADEGAVYQSEETISAAAEAVLAERASARENR
ncbi:MAG: proteasome subunit beta, partial [Thermocrispum sp.]